MKNSIFHFRGIRGRLFIASVIPVIGFVIISATGFFGVSRMKSQSDISNAQIIPKISQLAEALNAQSSVGYYVWAALGSYYDEKQHKAYVLKARESFATFEKSVQAFEAIKRLDGENEILSELERINGEFSKETARVIDLIDKNQPDTREIALESISTGVWFKHSTQVQGSVEKLKSFYSEKSKEVSLAATKVGNETTTILSLTSVVATTITFVFLIVLGMKLSSAVSSVVAQLKQSGTQVSDAIFQLSSAGQTLSQSSTSAAAALEETVASLEEMSSMVKMNSDNALQASSLSQASRGSAEKGEQEIKLLVESMKDIASSSKRIEEIIQVIDDIAFQTNLLALNAAVEAARAGDQGKGFAVVAEAVRALAQRSATAAKDISTLISESVSKIERGTTIADKSGAVMSEIVQSVKKVSDLASEIASASGEQTAGITQVNKAMNSLDQGAQANAASSEEIAGTAEDISSQAQNMRNLVEELNKIVIGADEGKEAA